MAELAETHSVTKLIPVRWIDLDAFPTVAVACGDRLFIAAAPSSPTGWTAELSRLIEARAAAASSGNAHPGVAALARQPPPLA